MPDLDGFRVVEAIRRKQEQDDASGLLQRMEVATYTGGLVTLQEPGGGEVIDQTFAWGFPDLPVAGMEVMVMDLGGGEYFAVCPVRRGPIPDLLAFAAAYIGRTYHSATDSTNSTNNNNASATVWVEALQHTLTVPNGTYEVTAIGSCLLAHDTSLAANLRLNIEGTPDSSITSPNLSTVAQTRVATATRYTGVVVADGGVTVILEYKCNAVGGATGASARNDHIEVHATRTG